ncbi:subclass B3 metallo-beta-lactamase [Rhizobium sp. TH2]|uniref:subclass B3 metallo-beta-lactamase n=1 Tax=Rhizobium sp. TH2 TaxID=2775403 RepID=UPI0021585CDF|nr:subclass B3 metallo-beta-lactamase [Rhizobium sp. TH2]
MAATAFAAQPAAWTKPTKPFKILDNIYYVGTEGLASYLIVSDQGAILLDGTLAENAGHIEKNIRALGFELSDVKIILNSHAHFDHAAGIAQLKQDTGAKVMAMQADRSALENGKQEGDTNYGGATFPAVKVDRVLNDGDVVTLGKVNMVAIATPGHTKGCTTWQTAATDNGVSRRVVFPCSITVAGNILVGNKGYPGIVEDFRRSFERMASLEADIVLPAHPEFAGVFQREAKQEAGDKDAYVDTELLPRLVKKSKIAFEKELKAAQK